MRVVIGTNNQRPIWCLEANRDCYTCSMNLFKLSTCAFYIKDYRLEMQCFALLSEDWLCYYFIFLLALSLWRFSWQHYQVRRSNLLLKIPNNYYKYKVQCGPRVAETKILQKCLWNTFTVRNFY